MTMKLQPPREIVINACLSGFIVRCGCQTLVFTTLSSLMAELHKYLTNPMATEREYINAALYDTMRDRPPEVARIVNNPCCEPTAAPVSESEYRALRERADRTIASMAESLAPRQDEARGSVDQERRTRDPILR